MANDPKSACDAILDGTGKVAADKTYTLYPLSAGRYALLELLGSPYVVIGKDFSVASLLPTMYVMTHSYDDLAGYTSSNIGELERVAMRAGDDMSVDDVTAFSKAFTEKLNALNKMAPEVVDKSPDKKKDQAAGG